MIRTELTTLVERPLDEVFAYVGDQTNTPRWQAGLVEVTRLTDGPLRVGTRHRFVRQFLGRRMAGTNEYTAFEPGRRITFKGIAGPIPLEASYFFEATADGTNVTSRVQMWPTGLAVLFQPWILRSLQREMKAGGLELKRQLESHDGAAPAAAHLV
jgi:uncharacterized protein YndB with AHSA1/START domain